MSTCVWIIGYFPPLATKFMYLKELIKKYSELFICRLFVDMCLMVFGVLGLKRVLIFYDSGEGCALVGPLRGEKIPNGFKSFFKTFKFWYILSQNISFILFFLQEEPAPRSWRSWFILLKRYNFLFFWNPKIVHWSVKSISFSPCSPFHFLSWNNHGGFHKDPKLWFKIWFEIIFCVVWCFHSVACLLGMESTLLGPKVSYFVLPFSKSYLLGFCR